MLSLCRRTVCSLIARRSAIDLFANPSASRMATSRSRLLSPAAAVCSNVTPLRASSRTTQFRSDRADNSIAVAEAKSNVDRPQRHGRCRGSVDGLKTREIVEELHPAALQLGDDVCALRLR